MCLKGMCFAQIHSMEMIYHRLAYILILHHWDHMHNMNHKDFSRGVTGFRIKVENIWECSSKAIETSGAKMNQLKLEYIRHRSEERRVGKECW